MPKVKSVYDHIRINNIKTLFLVLLFPIVLMAMVWCGLYLATYLFQEDTDYRLVGAKTAISFFPSVENKINEENYKTYVTLGYFMLTIVPTLIFSAIWLIFVFFKGSSAMLSMVGAHKAVGKEYQQLNRSVENVAIMAGLPKPTVYIIEDESMNAFTTGSTPQNACIAFSTGIVKNLKPLELEGVIAHEMAHIGNRDVRLNMMILTGIGIFAFLADSFGSVAFRSRRSRRNEGGLVLVLAVLVLVFRLFSYVIAPLIFLMVSRTREYNADATGAKITHNPRALADALHKIGLDSRIEALGTAQTVASLCIADSRYKCAHLIKNDGWFSTHPPIHKRIRRLKSMG